MDSIVTRLPEEATLEGSPSATSLQRLELVGGKGRRGALWPMRSCSRGYREQRTSRRHGRYSVGEHARLESPLRELPEEERVAPAGGDDRLAS